MKATENKSNQVFELTNRYVQLWILCSVWRFDYIIQQRSTWPRVKLQVTGHLLEDCCPFAVNLQKSDDTRSNLTLMVPWWKLCRWKLWNIFIQPLVNPAVFNAVTRCQTPFTTSDQKKSILILHLGEYIFKKCCTLCY